MGKKKKISFATVWPNEALRPVPVYMFAARNTLPLSFLSIFGENTDFISCSVQLRSPKKKDILFLSSFKLYLLETLDEEKQQKIWAFVMVISCIHTFLIILLFMYLFMHSCNYFSCCLMLSWGDGGAGDKHRQTVSRWQETIWTGRRSSSGKHFSTLTFTCPVRPVNKAGTQSR